MAITASLDKASYPKGSIMTLTVTSDKRITATDVPITTGAEGAKVTVTVWDRVAITDPLARTWKLVSDDGTTAKFQATA